MPSSGKLVLVQGMGVKKMSVVGLIIKLKLVMI